MEDWDVESILPSWLRHGAPIGILEEVETAGVFALSRFNEQPRNPASLCMCLAGWSNCASAEDESQIANQLLQIEVGMGHCLLFDTLDEVKSYMGVGHVVLSKLALLTKLEKDEVRSTVSSGTFFGLRSTVSLTERTVLPHLEAPPASRRLGVARRGRGPRIPQRTDPSV